MNTKIDHLYNCYLRTGMERHTESEVLSLYGRDAFERYSDHIDHSEWCECRNFPEDVTDPFHVGILDSEPPF